MHKVVLISKGKRIIQLPPNATHLEVSVDGAGGGGREQPAKPEPVRQDVNFMLAWCRSHIPGFADCQDRALASKLVGSGK